MRYFIFDYNTELFFILFFNLLQYLLKKSIATQDDVVTYMIAPVVALLWTSASKIPIKKWV